MRKPTVERWMVCAVVLLAHVLLLWSWRFVARPALRDPSPGATPTLTQLRLIAPTAAPSPSEQDARAAEPVPLATPSRTAPRKPPDAAPAAPASSTVQAPPEPAASAPAIEPRALELAVPRAAAAPAPRAMKDQMLNDPRANSPRRTVESRIADVSGTSTMSEERMDDSKTRFRQDGACIEVHVSRDAQTNPWNQNNSPTPKIVKPSC